MEQSPRLSLSYVAPNQAQKHVTVNEALRRLDALVQAAVLSRTQTAEPASPAEGDAYILPGGASGAAWDGFDPGDVAAFQDGAWARIVPAEGFRLWVADDDEFVIYDGAAWGALSGGGGVGEAAAKFGINTSADATNKLAVKSDAVLFSHDDVTPGSGDAQVKVNKAAPGDTASHLFQTNFSGRAEFGLTGDDDFHVKVSPDNFATSYEALVIDKDNGDICIGGANPAARLHVKGTSSALLTVECAGDVPNFQFASEQSSGSVGRMFWYGEDDGGATSIYGLIDVNIDSNAAGSEEGSFRMRPANGGGISDTSVFFTVSAGGCKIGNPTGGHKGAGTLNAVAVYDDNTILSCYVFDQVLDGSLDIEKWDAKVPDRIIADEEGKTLRRVARLHEPMRKFASRIGTGYDPLTLDGYARHWRERRHLPSLPNEATFDPEKGLPAGAWIQRLVETVEIQAVLIEELNARLKSVEMRASNPGVRQA